MMSPMEAIRHARKRAEEEHAGAFDPTNDTRHQAACRYAGTVLFALSAAVYLDAETCERWADEESAAARACEAAGQALKAFECRYAASMLRCLAHDIRKG